MTTKRLSYGRQSIDRTDIDAVRAVLESDFLTQGPAVERFEAALAERVGAKHAVAVNSGTAGLHIACLAAGLTDGKRGLTAAMTFVASANAIKYTKAAAGLVDIDPHGLGLSVSDLEDAMKATGADAVIPVHFGGLAMNAAAVRKAAGSAMIIEDACHALGGAYDTGEPVGCGAFSDMAVFSFHPVKPITTAEGGAVVTNDASLARHLRRLRSHGIERDAETFSGPQAEPQNRGPWSYEQQEIGFNYRLSDVHAALGLSQLSRLDDFISRRREIAAYYDAAFVGVPGLEVYQNDPALRARSALHLYVVGVDWSQTAFDRAGFMAALSERGIGTQVHYIPVHHHPVHADMAGGASAAKDGLANTEAYYEKCLTIPLHQSLTDEDAEHAAGTVKELLGS